MNTTGHDTKSAHAKYMHDNFMVAYRMAKLSRDLLAEDDLREVYKDAILGA